MSVVALHATGTRLTWATQSLKDNEAQVARLKKDLRAARAKEAKARTQAEEQGHLLLRAEKELIAAARRLDVQKEEYDLLHQQCIVAAEDANRQRIRAAKAENQTEELAEEMKHWRERATKSTKKVWCGLLSGIRAVRPITTDRAIAVLCFEERFEAAEARSTKPLSQQPNTHRL